MYIHSIKYFVVHPQLFPLATSAMESLQGKMDTGSEMGGIVAATCLPDKYPPVRVRDSYSTKPVAVAKPIQEVKINWANAVAGDIPTTDMVLFLFRNTARHFIFYDSNPTNATNTQAWRSSNDSANPTRFITAAGPGPSSLGIHEIEPTASTPLTPYQPHGPILFAGEAEGHKYMWVDQGGGIAVTNNITGAVGNNDLTFEVFQYVDGRRQLAYSSSVNAAAIPATFSTGTTLSKGYYNILITHTAGSDTLNYVTVISSNGGGPAGCWCHRPISGFTSNIQKIQACAITAASLLWRNTASYQNAQGDFGATQVGKGVGWETVAGQGGYSGIAAAYANQWVSRFAAKGEYAFMKPEDAEDFAMNSDVEQGSTTWSTCTFPLEERSAFLVFAASVSDAAGRDTTVRLAAHVQFETNDTWSDIRPPTSIRADWENAMAALCSMEQFYENPTHIREILASIGKYGRVAVDIASYLLSTFGSEKLSPYGEQVKRLGPVMETLAGLKKKKKM